MPDCQNCGAHVTEQYAKVFTPNDVDQPRACPFCPDRVRAGDGFRKARSQRGDRRSGRVDPDLDFSGGDGDGD